jgi:hypothetical protein
MPLRRDLSQVRKLSRTPSLSYAQKAADPNRPRRPAESPVRFNMIGAFLPTNLWKWITSYFRNRIGPRHTLPSYTGSDRGIYQFESDAGEVRLSIVGDWGTGTDEAHDVAEQMKKFRPHYTIHLGDVYYVGDESEVRENCLNQKVTEYEPCEWPHGSVGSFALNGNHEMYARGFGYFDVFLPTLGLTGGPGQRTSFFCLENEHWRFIALDTGYNSVKIPILELIPFPPFHADCALPDELLTWLVDVVKPNADERAIVLLGHHQYYSAFERGYEKPARQLRRLIGRPVIWFWGHEHRLALYDKHAEPGGVEAYGRCLGHGGMPIELQKPGSTVPLQFFDARPYPNDEGLSIGYNGHADVTLAGNTMRIDYVDVAGSVVVSESWVTDHGTLTRANSVVPA